MERNLCRNTYHTSLGTENITLPAAPENVQAVRGPKDLQNCTLTLGINYYFRVDSFNTKGITEGNTTKAY